MTYCTPGPSSTKLPSAPFLSPSVTCSSSPITGSMSLLVTFLPLATFVTPAGARKGSRGRPRGFCRLGTVRFCGVPSNIGFGSWMGIGTSFPPARALAGAGRLGVERAGEEAEGEKGRDPEARRGGRTAEGVGVGMSVHAADYPSFGPRVTRAV